jgi:hypothetical protein
MVVMRDPLRARPPGWIRCTACADLLRRDPLCSDLAVITLHWMSRHRDRWIELHPEAAEYI